MSTDAIPEYIISPMRELTMPELTYFHAATQPTPFAELDKALDPLLESLHSAIAQAHLTDVSPDLLRYYPAPSEAGAGPSDRCLMEVGVAVQPGSQTAGAAQVKVLPPFHCAAVLLWGGMTHVVEAYGVLKKAAHAAGLQTAGEYREWYYRVESGDSPHNVIGVYVEIG